MLPGAIYDALYQCRMEFPNSMGICGKGDQLCNELSCQVSETECMMNGEPAADGTRCGENKVSVIVSITRNMWRRLSKINEF